MFLSGYDSRLMGFYQAMIGLGNQCWEETINTRDYKNLLEEAGIEWKMEMDGSEMDPPTNFELLSIASSWNHCASDDEVRIIDEPRAGRGAGISLPQIMEALKAGCKNVYYIGFKRSPIPSQTLDDVLRTKIRFMKYVVEKHPGAQVVIYNNCAAGWMWSAAEAYQPEKFSDTVKILSGSPKSYHWGADKPIWNIAMLSGGKWMIAMLADLFGEFDGANNGSLFELNDLPKMIDGYLKLWDDPSLSPVQRFVEQKRWFLSFYSFTKEEMLAICDLFSGNQLETGKFCIDGKCVDLAKSQSATITFCSDGDTVSSPPEALGDILAVYGTLEELKESGRVSVYCFPEEKPGHLKIFASPKIGEKYHATFAKAAREIRALSPGLYEMIIEQKDGEYVFHLEERTFEDLRIHFPENKEELFRKGQRFADVSEWLYTGYEMFFGPWMRAFSLPTRMLRPMIQFFHPMRSSIWFSSQLNPFSFWFCQMEKWRRSQEETPEAAAA